MRRFWRSMMVCLLLSGFAGPTAAEGLYGFVIGDTGPETDAVAEKFAAWGIDNVYRSETVSDQPNSEVSAVDGLILYVAQEPDSFAPLVSLIAAKGATQAAILIENCPSAQASSLAVDLPEGVSLYVVRSVAEGQSCDAAPMRLTEHLLDLGDTAFDLQSAFSAFPSTSTIEGPITLGQRAEPAVSIVTDEVVVLTPVEPTRAAQPVVRGMSDYARASSGVLILDAGNEAQIQPVPVRAGLPQPYIRVGLFEPVPEFTPTPAVIDVSVNEVTFDNIVERRRLRRDDPTLFQDLLETGAFDPPSNQLVIALQTELERLRCYNAGVDGQWGGGSRRGVTRFFDEIEGVDPVSLEPGLPLYRQILELEDVVCPPETPVAQAPAAAAPARTTPRATPTRTAPTRTSRPRQTAQPAAPRPRQTAPAPTTRKSQANPKIRLGTGVFR